MTGTHSKMSPSSLYRRRACPGSYTKEQGLDDTSSVYALEGSCAHEAGEICLREGITADELIGRVYHNTEIDQTMANYVQEYADYCRGLGCDDFEIEAKMDLPFLGPNERGTGDFVGVAKNILHVVDLKYGQGVAVEPEANDQLISYGLGAAKRFHNRPWDVMRLTVYQPRAPHPVSRVRSWDIPRDEIMDWMVDLLGVADTARDPDAIRVAGPHCQFCKANVIDPETGKYLCDTRQAAADDVLSSTFTNVDETDSAALGEAFLKIKPIEDWCKAVKTAAMKQHNAGFTPAGLKAVATRASRKYKDDKAARNSMLERGITPDELYVKSTRSPAQIEKELGKKRYNDIVADLVESKSSGVVLVAEDDPRPSVRTSAADTFSTVE